MALLPSALWSLLLSDDCISSFHSCCSYSGVFSCSRYLSSLKKLLKPTVHYPLSTKWQTDTAGTSLVNTVQRLQSVGNGSKRIKYLLVHIKVYRFSSLVFFHMDLTAGEVNENQKQKIISSQTFGFVLHWGIKHKT